MKEVSSNITSLVQRAGELLGKTAGAVDCKSAQTLMSPFIDSMCTSEEVEKLECHLNTCEPCQRQLQSYISVRNLLTRVEQPAPPVDLVLDTRVKLSQERHRNYLATLENRLSNILKPIAIPAIAGVSLTMLLFGVLLGTMISNTTVMAHNRVSSISDQRAPGLYKPVRTTNLTMIQFAGSDTNKLAEPLMIETHVGETGRVLDYKIISGEETPEVEQFVREQLSLATFTPATAFGRPVESKIILSFVAVKS
jgi:Putative zinc-finger